MWKSLPQWARGLVQFIISLLVLLMVAPFVITGLKWADNRFGSWASWVPFIAVVALGLWQMSKYRREQNRND